MPLAIFILLVLLDAALVMELISADIIPLDAPAISFTVIVVLIVVFLSLTIFSNLARGYFTYSDQVLFVFCQLALIVAFVFSFAIYFSRDGYVMGVVADGWRDYLYFSTVTFTTLGYGDFQPAESHRLIASLEALIGFLFVPVLITQFLSVVDGGNDNSQSAILDSSEEVLQENLPEFVTEDSVVVGDQAEQT